ncbi:ABC transporter substrate-binding protein [Salipiger sp. 1_MG-2023]|uniref:ABC transporter substrate-binding protein n=1 Tax=Salipiger sp. 1_MG-2023 TaxID=3062665 RepID=UPI0026E3EA43|nr:ABC transporter substrate-binding protein [Salipiger sp. 1_MG-2023]MDO6585223.1 ABC transporter substrate-binding protein [Salipiger sp. 1_MG-2023]
MNQHFQKDCAEILTERHAKGQISRRQMMAGLGALLGTTTLGLGARGAQAAEGQLVFVNWGGDALDAMDAAFGQPFTAESGIKVLYDGSGPTEGAIIAQSKSGSPTWDLVDAEPFSAQALGRQGMMTPIDYDIVDPAKQREGFGWEYASSCYFYSYVIAYDATQFDTPPTSLADFFDAENFPGKRAMYKWGAGMWEAALLADGVAPADLYPLDLDRAHKKIEAFKDHIGAFWGGGAESQSLLLNGDVSMALIWNTRATLLHKDTEGEITYTYDDGIIGPGGIAVLAGNPGGTEAAMQYIASTQVPERQVELFMLLGNGPSNPAADSLIPEDERRFNPMDPANLPKQVALDMDWYETNYSAALDAYLQIISA